MSCIKMTVLLVSVLFLPTMSFTIKKILPLNMADKSVDDSYEGCRDDMNKLVISKYMEHEKLNTPGFASAWNRSLKRSNVKDGLNINQSAAIYMYTVEPTRNTDCSYAKFNIATRDGSSAYTSDHFQFYTLHFFLTDAVQQLKRSQKGCVTTYRRTKVRFETNVLNKEIRFGSFTSTSLRKDLIDFGRESCFQIYTCFGAKVKKFSTLKIEEEVLIPPYETFRVTAIKENDEDLDCDMGYELESVGKMSNLNCVKIKSALSAFVPSLLVTVLLLTLVLATCIYIRRHQKVRQHTAHTVEGSYYKKPLIF